MTIKELLEDTQGIKGCLNYLRAKDGKEIDFLICLDNKPTHLIEVKMSDSNPAQGFQHFEKLFPATKQIQLVKNLLRDTSFPNGLLVRKLIPWLAQFLLDK